MGSKPIVSHASLCLKAKQSQSTSPVSLHLKIIQDIGSAKILSISCCYWFLRMLPLQTKSGMSEYREIQAIFDVLYQTGKRYRLSPLQTSSYMPWNNAREKQALMSYFPLLLILWQCLIIMKMTEGTIWNLIRIRKKSLHYSIFFTSYICFNTSSAKLIQNTPLLS